MPVTAQQRLNLIMYNLRKLQAENPTLMIDPSFLGTGGEGEGEKFLADDGTFKTVSGEGLGDMVGANNLSEITDEAEARDNIGAAAALGADDNYMTDAEKTKLSGIATGATANATDAQLRDRASHTGAQAIATVTGLQAALDGKASALGSDDNYVTDAEKTVIGNTSGSNTGDQDLSGLATKTTTITINGVAFDLSANRSWTVTAGGDIAVSKRVLTGNFTLAAGESGYVTGSIEIPSGNTLEIGAGAILEIG